MKNTFLLSILLTTALLVGCKNQQAVENEKLVDSTIENEISLNSPKEIEFIDSTYVKWLNTLSKEDATFNKTDSIGINSNGVYHFIYRNPINGYKVKGVLYNPYANNEILGTAILEFEKDHSHHIVAHPFFSIEREEIGGIRESLKKENSKAFFTVSDKYIGFYLDYKIAKSDTSFLRTSVPFFFKDVNFDGKDELVLRLPMMGQRRYDSYRVYSLESDLDDDLMQITKEEPYKSFDETTSFDVKKKEIVIHRSGGAFFWRDEFYKAGTYGNMNLYRIEDVRDLVKYVYEKDGEEITLKESYKVK